MNIRDITLKKHTTKDIVNDIFRNNNINLAIKDSTYLGVEHKHVWICECGNEFERIFKSIKRYECISCQDCRKTKEDFSFIKNMSLKKYSSKEIVNEQLRNKLKLKDDIYLGASHNHKWICSCENTFERRFNTIKTYMSLRCSNCVKGVKHTYEKIKDVHISVKMSKDIINNLIGKWILLEDDTYLGNSHLHNWRCSCGNIIYKRQWAAIKGQNQILCRECNNKPSIEMHKKEVNKVEGYKYIKTYFKGELLPDNSIANNTTLEIEHKYCGSIYHIRSTSFINDSQRCSNCCRKYENSFAYHVERELGEPIEKYWDFDKNTANPYHIWKSGSEYVWIKCQNEDINILNGLKKKEYHGSYIIKCNNFFTGYRCSYCSPIDNMKVHPYDSFGYYNFDKIMHWLPENDISPFKVGRYSNKKYKFICRECNNIFNKRLSDITSYDQWCPECSMSEGEKKISDWLMCNDIKYEYEKEFEGLTGIGGGNLSYDFYLYDYNLLIEYQGDQHKKFIPIFHKTYKDFEKQLEHDARKREYASKNGYRLIEIWEDDFDNIVEILKNELE